MNKQLKRANETINILNGNIQDNEELIVKVNKYIKKAKDNLDYKSVTRFEEIKRELKQNRREMKQSKKKLMLLMADCTEMDKSTMDAHSNIPLTRVILQSKYRISDSFKDVTLNSINDNLPVRLSSNALNKVILEVFPEVESRRITGDIKYNMELIK